MLAWPAERDLARALVAAECDHRGQVVCGQQHHLELRAAEPGQAGRHQPWVHLRRQDAQRKIRCVCNQMCILKLYSSITGTTSQVG